LTVNTWIAHQYAARFDQVQELLSLHPGKPMKDELISEAVTRDQVTRWRKAGWVEYKRFLAEGPGWVWLTRKGLQTIGLDALYTSKAPAATRLHHIYAVNEVRLIVETDGGSVRRYPAIWFYVPDENMKRSVEAARAKLPESWQTYMSILEVDLSEY
jgi:hypothetical protein